MFSSYEELMEAVEELRTETLTLEVDLGAKYSPEHEEAKKELQRAQAMKAVTGAFLSDDITELEERVAATKPAGRSAWVRFRRLGLKEWSLLVRSKGLTPLEQYEKVLSKTFVGVYGVDPNVEEGEEEVEPLSTDPSLLSSEGTNGILPGGLLHQVVQAFISWQNSGGEVTIHPTKSGQD